MARVVNLDVFAGDVFWLSTGQSEGLYRQDKFGRGLKQAVLPHLKHGASVKVFYPHQYFTQSKYKPKISKYRTCPIKHTVSMNIFETLKNVTNYVLLSTKLCLY